MKLTKTLVALTSLFALTGAFGEPEDGFDTKCQEKYLFGGYDDWIFRSLLDIWHDSFGGGGGSLDGSYGPRGGSGMAYQGVCCNMWCLYVEKKALHTDYNKGAKRFQSHWNDDDFNAAADRIRAESIGRGGGCSTVMNRTEDVSLHLVPHNFKTSFQEDGMFTKSLEVWGEMGNTCAGDQPYRGPTHFLRTFEDMNHCVSKDPEKVCTNWRDRKPKDLDS